MNKILDTVKTSEDRNRLIEEFDTLLNGLYQNKGEGLDSLLYSRVRAWVAELLREELSVDEINPRQYLKNIKDELNAFKTVSISLAFEPTESNIEKFSYIVKKSAGYDTLIEFSYNPSLIGGCTIIFEGKYKDFSMKSYFESEFAKIKQDLFIQMAH